MFNSGVLDVAIGLIFVYLLLSLVCSAINEIIEGKLKLRAVDLERGIRGILSDKSDASLVKKFYDHPLIFSLFEGSYDPTKVDAKTNRYKSGSNLPSYIPSRNFALALMDLVLPASPAAGGAASSGAAGATAPAPSPKPLQPLRDAIEAMSNDTIKRALLPLVDAAGDDASKARENIEAWFDSTMDRVSGWYKRRVQWFILAIGLVVAVVVNADTIVISDSLSQDVALRNALVAAAGEYAKANPSIPPSPQSVAKLEVCKQDQNSPECEACKQDQNSPECKVAKNLDQIRKLGLPVGWNMKDERLFPRTAGGWVFKIFGLLITAAAVSLGAPFWFDLLNKIMIVRSTVKPREKSPEEPPVDRAEH